MIELAALVGVSAALRFYLNRVKQFSTADEAVMLGLALQSTDPRYQYRSACSEWLNYRENYIYPGIVRFGNIFLLRTIYWLTGRLNFRVMSTVSSVAGIASVLLTYLLALRISPGSELYAGIMVATSPLQLHIGRRALQDELIAASAIGAMLAISSGHFVVTVALLAALISVKESTAALVPAICVFGWFCDASPTGLCIVTIAVPTLYVAAFWVASRDIRLLPRLMKAIASARNHCYAREQEGAPHRLVTDLFLLSPVVVLTAARAHFTAAVGFLLAYLIVHAALPGLRSIRMATASDSVLRIVAAGVLANWQVHAALMLLAAMVIADATIFWRVFLKENVYDPITINIVRALGMTSKTAH